MKPSVERGSPPGTAGDRRIAATCLLVIGVPFLFGVIGSVMLAPEALGPLITLAVWLVMFVVHVIRYRRFDVSVLAVVGCLLTLQLLLDLHTRWLGDIVVGALHAVILIAIVVASRNDERGAGRAPLEPHD